MNYQHPNCYASTLGNCSKQISREHYCSRSILEILNEHGGLFIEGLPSIKTKNPLNISPNSALNGNILCSKHNSDLSQIDSAFESFFKNLIELNQILNTSTSSVSKNYSCNGVVIERWMLKFLCGLIISGNATHNGSLLLKLKPKYDFLECLFGLVSFPNSWGLYFIGPPGTLFKSGSGIKFATLVDGDKNVCGAKIEMLGFSFILAMANITEEIRFKHPLMLNALYRPTAFNFVSQKNSSKINLDIIWDSPGDGKAVQITYL